MLRDSDCVKITFFGFWVINGPYKPAYFSSYTRVSIELSSFEKQHKFVWKLASSWQHPLNLSFGRSLLLMMMVSFQNWTSATNTKILRASTHTLTWRNLWRRLVYGWWTKDATSYSLTLWLTLKEDGKFCSLWPAKRNSSSHSKKFVIAHNFASRCTLLLQTPTAHLTLTTKCLLNHVAAHVPMEQMRTATTDEAALACLRNLFFLFLSEFWMCPND